MDKFSHRFTSMFRPDGRLYISYQKLFTYKEDSFNEF